MIPDVLIVDDDRSWGESLVDALSLWGFTAISVTDTHDAWSIYEERHPRSVLTDHNMPAMTGLQLARCIKASDNPVPVVMVSAWPPPDADHVCDQVLCKPVPLPLLVDTLRALGISPRLPLVPRKEE